MKTENHHEIKGIQEGLLWIGIHFGKEVRPYLPLLW
jgi:hypothetical protein